MHEAAVPLERLAALWAICWGGSFLSSCWPWTLVLLDQVNEDRGSGDLGILGVFRWHYGPTGNAASSAAS